MHGLRRLRKERGVTQSKLAKAIGVSISTISMWEHGNAFPRKETLEALCKFFDCKVDDLL